MPARRIAAPSAVVRGRAVVVAVAMGAIVAAVVAPSLFPGEHADADSQGGVAVGTSADSPAVRPIGRGATAGAEAHQLAESQEITGQQSVDTLDTDGRHTVSYATPADGTVVATFGGQYGSFHYGIEIKNVKGTPIVAAADGVIIAAGPTDGFGLWVKEQLPDGTTLVYARVDTYSVQVGQHVTAGQRIARMGDRGFGADYTLHFEVWSPTGKKIDPEEWLNQRGVTV